MMSSGTLPPAAAHRSKYHVSHFRGLSFHNANVAKIEELLSLMKKEQAVFGDKQPLVGESPAESLVEPSAAPTPISSTRLPLEMLLSRV